MSLKPYKLGLSKVVKLKTIMLHLILAEDLFSQGFTFITYIFLKVIKGHDPLEGKGVEVGTSKYLPMKYFSL